MTDNEIFEHVEYDRPNGQHVFICTIDGREFPHTFDGRREALRLIREHVIKLIEGSNENV